MRHSVVEAALRGASRQDLWRAHTAIRDATKELNAFSDWREDCSGQTGSGNSLLHGAVAATKANLCSKGLRASAGSRMLQNYVAPYDSVAVERLVREGAIVAAASNMDEFGMGSSTSASVHGATYNPYSAPVAIRRAAAAARSAATTTSAQPLSAAVAVPWPAPSSRAWLTPGGSSGGSAVAVAVSSVGFALGSDTGGSVRQPASFCGVVGLKPTYGRVPRWGLIAYASSLDTVGVLARSVADAVAVYDVIGGPDPRDDTCLRAAPASSHGALAPGSPSVMAAVRRHGGDFLRWRLERWGTGRWTGSPGPGHPDLSGLRVGVPREYSVAGLAPEIGDWWERGTRWLRECGAEIVPVSLPHTAAALPAYYVLAPAEAASNLSRYDGVRYGYRAADVPRASGSPAVSENAAAALHDEFSRTRSEGFGAEVRRRLLIGNFVLSRGARRDYYDAAQRVRALVGCDFSAAFRGRLYASEAGVDVLLTPASPTLPWSSHPGSEQDPLSALCGDAMTVPASLAGLPALAVPVGHVPYPADALAAALAEARAAGMQLSPAAEDRVRSHAVLPVGLQLIGRAGDEETVLAVGAALEARAAFVRPWDHWQGPDDAALVDPAAYWRY